MNSFSEQYFYKSINQNTLDYKEKKLPYTWVNRVNAFLQALLLSGVKGNLFKKFKFPLILIENFIKYYILT